MPGKLRLKKTLPGKQIGTLDYVPTVGDREDVIIMAAVGITHKQIAACLNISDDTLRKHYRDELDHSADRANANVAKSLYQSALNGDTTAAIFWMKCRLQWKDASTIIHEAGESFRGQLTSQPLTTQEWEELYGGKKSDPNTIEHEPTK